MNMIKGKSCTSKFNSFKAMLERSMNDPKKNQHTKSLIENKSFEEIKFLRSKNKEEFTTRNISERQKKNKLKTQKDKIFPLIKLNKEKKQISSEGIDLLEKQILHSIHQFPKQKEQQKTNPLVGFYQDIPNQNQHNNKLNQKLLYKMRDLIINMKDKKEKKQKELETLIKVNTELQHKLQLCNKRIQKVEYQKLELQQRLSKYQNPFIKNENISMFKLSDCKQIEIEPIYINNPTPDFSSSPKTEAKEKSPVPSQYRNMYHMIDGFLKDNKQNIQLDFLKKKRVGGNIVRKK